MKNFTHTFSESQLPSIIPDMEGRPYDINNPEDIADCLAEEPEYECYGAEARDLALYSAKQIVENRRRLFAQRISQPRQLIAAVPHPIPISTVYVAVASPSDRAAS
jgi:hypothetical protein